MNRWTQLAQIDRCDEDPYHANSTPIYQTATFAQESALAGGDYDYSRSGNPTRRVLEQQLAKLEQAEYAFAFSSGMAALTALSRVLKQGDHLIAGTDLYGGTHRLLSKLLPHTGIEVSWVDSTDLGAVAAAIRPQTRLILVETPTNPLQEITDLCALAELIAGSDILLAVDNSLMSPWLQQPLTLGADIVIHSATKHLAGHSDLTAGVLVVNDKDLADTIGFVQNATGSALAPFDSWLLSRGIKTLGLRLERQQANAQRVADFLVGSGVVKRIYYPGLADHPAHAIHCQQARGGGNLISFETGSFDRSRDIVDKTKLFTISVSFGSIQSLISLPCQMSHTSIPDEERRLAPDLIRLSIGIEDPDDLIADLRQAIDNVRQIHAA